MRCIQDIDCKGKKVLVRVDFNVPIEDGVVKSTKRIEAALPTIRYLLEQGAVVYLVSHLGRPQEGVFDDAFSLKPLVPLLESYLEQPVGFTASFLEGVIPETPCVLFENIRFYAGEKACSEVLSKKLAHLCDIFVMDAFGTLHREHASTYGVACFVQHACAGFLLQKEIQALDHIMLHGDRPRLAIVGGSKVSTKLAVLSSLAQKVDGFIVGGGIANTFLRAQGYSIGKSLYEPDFVRTAQEFMEQYIVYLPKDVAVVKQIDATHPVLYKPVTAVLEDEYIVDVGALSCALYTEKIMDAATIMWNGPVGIFEIPSMAYGTTMVLEAIRSSSAYCVAGGGDTVYAIESLGSVEDVSYLSTGGGAFLEYIEGRVFPLLEMLRTS